MHLLRLYAVVKIQGKLELPLIAIEKRPVKLYFTGLKLPELGSNQQPHG